MAHLSFGECHLLASFEGGRWYLEGSIQYWTIFRIEISERDARAISDKVRRVDEDRRSYALKWKS